MVDVVVGVRMEYIRWMGQRGRGAEGGRSWLCVYLKEATISILGKCCGVNTIISVQHHIHTLYIPCSNIQSIVYPFPAPIAPAVNTTHGADLTEAE